MIYTLNRLADKNVDVCKVTPRQPKVANCNEGLLEEKQADEVFPDIKSELLLDVNNANFNSNSERKIVHSASRRR